MRREKRKKRREMGRVAEDWIFSQGDSESNIVHSVLLCHSDQRSYSMFTKEKIMTKLPLKKSILDYCDRFSNLFTVYRRDNSSPLRLYFSGLFHGSTSLFYNHLNHPKPYIPGGPAGQGGVKNTYKTDEQDVMVRDLLKTLPASQWRTWHF